MSIPKVICHKVVHTGGGGCLYLKLFSIKLSILGEGVSIPKAIRHKVVHTGGGGVYT